MYIIEFECINYFTVKRNNLRAMRVLAFFLVTFLYSAEVFSPIYAQPQDGTSSYEITTPYFDAVPAFLDAVGDAVQDVENKEEIVEWAENLSAHLPGFLDDMVALSGELAAQQWGEYSFEPAEEFVEKWKGIIDTCPNCEDAISLVIPLIEDLFMNLPELREPRKGDVPLQNFYEFFGEMEAFNPWGIGGYFRIVPLKNSIKVLNIKESMKQTRHNGVEEKFIVDRITRKKVGYKVVFLEHIENDEVKEISFTIDAVTMLHEAIEEMKIHYENQLFIDFWEEIVAVVDDKLQSAVEGGQLDDFTYHYLFDQGPIRNELVHLYHPLMKYPRAKEYKAAEFYPRKFMDDHQYVQWEKMQQFADTQIIVHVSPQHVKRVQRATQAMGEYTKVSRNVLGGWVFGAVFPSYIFILLGAVRKLILV